MLPFLSEVQNASKKYSVVFRGVNYGEGTQDGEFAETYNLSTDQYPCITQRATRIKAGEYTQPSALHAKGNLLVIDGTKVFYDGKEVGEVTEGKKQTATIGNYIVIFPDKKYYRVPTEDTEGEFGSMEAECKESRLQFTASEISMDINNKIPWLEFTTSSISMGADYKASRLTFGTSSISVGTEYKATGLKFNATSISKSGANFPFKAGDAVTISGCSKSDNNKTTEIIIKTATADTLTFESESFTYINPEPNEVTITRKVKGDFPFKTGDAVTISGCSKSENNKTTEITIKEAKSNKLTFEDDSFVEAIEDGEVTITRKTKYKFPFKQGDSVTITGCAKSENNKSEEIVIKEATDNTLTFEANSFVEAIEYGEITITRKVAGSFPFKEGDAVTITGCSNNGNNKTAEIIIRGVEGNKLTFDDNAFTEAIEDGEVTISRTVPDLDFICESNYRLWGTHGNTIYSSKFSDPLNFQVFDGLQSDSYAIEVGSEGEFTGCIPYSSHICFFKENTLHKIYGTKPSNFQVTTVNVYGVQSGSEKSMQIVNEQLLYKGVGGIYAYTGGVPELISEKFGNKRYSEAVACCDGEKYYISMKQGDTWNMFAYDVLKNIWLREDDTHAVDMAFYDGKVYYLDAKGDLYYIDKMADRNDIEWGATFCTMHETMNERKGYSKFHLRMDLSAGAWLAVDIKTDNDLQWRQIYTTHNEKAKTVSIPIMPTRCDSIDIRLRGKGKCTIKAFIREFTVGSDV